MFDMLQLVVLNLSSIFRSIRQAKAYRTIELTFPKKALRL
jgi:hypothetical protein